MRSVRTVILTLFIHLSPILLYAQSENLKGQVLSQDGPLSFCTIGIKGKNLGTVSDLNGHFSIPVTDLVRNDSLTFSYVGFESTTISIRSLIGQEKIEILLKENLQQLNEVVINAKRTKQIEFGYKKETEVFLWIKGLGEGAEIASFIPLRKRVFLDEISFPIENDLGEEFTLLLNIYERDPTTGKPRNQLLKERTLIRSSKKEGRIIVDISNQNIEVNKPFFISLKWIDISKEMPLLGMSFTNDKAFLRTVALGEWHVYLNANIKVKGTIIK